VLSALDAFYADVVQNLKAWAAAPPRLRSDAETEQPAVAPALVSAALSSQDDPEPARGASTEDDAAVLADQTR
jgi:hypothetical protein